MLSGHVRSLGGDTWELIVNLPPDVVTRQRKRTSKRITIKGVKRAERALSDWITLLEQHDCTDPQTITLAEVLRRWLEYAPENAGAKTMERYTELVDKHLVPDIGHRLVSELKDVDLYAYYRRKRESGRLDGKGGLSAQSCRHLHAVLRAALTFAQERSMVTDNVARRVKHPPKAEPQKRAVWGAVQVARAVRDAETTQLHVPAALAGWAGLRRGEVCSLRWVDVDLDGKALAVRQSVGQTNEGLHFGDPKTANARRVVPMPSQLVDLLREHKRRQDEMRLARGGGWNERALVCCRADGQPVNPDTLTTAWAQFVRQHALEPRLEFHGLRRSFLSRLHASGAPDSLVMAWAGHADLRTTHSHYLVTFDETEMAVVSGQETAIAAALREVCQCDASAVVPMAKGRRGGRP
jgi:integrase